MLRAFQTLSQGLGRVAHQAHRAAASGSAARLLSDGPISRAGGAGFRELLRQQDSAASLAGALRRRFSTEQASLKDVAQRLRGSAAAPVAAVKSAAGALAGVPGTAYQHLPQAARRWVDAAAKPGTLQRVAALQLEAFWERHGRKAILATCAVAAYAIWCAALRRPRGWAWCSWS